MERYKTERYLFVRNPEDRICVVDRDGVGYAMVMYPDSLPTDKPVALENFWKVLAATVPLEDWPKESELCFGGH